jgi:[ribosomal protein S18]-alanine N-acetyltransferase
MRVRRAQAADIPAMLKLERENPTSVNWSHEHYENLFRSAAPEPSRYLVLVVEDPSESKSVTESSTTPSIVAYLAAHHVDRDWELQYIVVAKESRRMGLGTYLLNEFISHVRATSGNRIFLEVRESNHAARALYRKAGFEPAGLRKSYYSNPAEDAILLRLALS